MSRGGDNLANKHNLIPFTSDQSREEAAKNGQKGGIASGAARRFRKTLRADLEALLDSPAPDGSGRTTAAAIALALVNRAIMGDTKAFEIIRDTIGEKPAERISLAQIDQDTIDAVEKMVMGCDGDPVQYE